MCCTGCLSIADLSEHTIPHFSASIIIFNGVKLYESMFLYIFEIITVSFVNCVVFVTFVQIMFIMNLVRSACMHTFGQ